MQENQVPASMPPQPTPSDETNRFYWKYNHPGVTENYPTPENLEQLKIQARMQAMQTVKPQIPPPGRVVYVRRNLTVAELIVVFLISCGLVLGFQGTWHLANNLPSIEVKWNK
jgi:hypothetical protein